MRNLQSLTWIVAGLTAVFLLLLCLPIVFHVPLDRRVMVWILIVLIVVPVLSFMVWLTMYRQP
jgi:type IV secretory pathway component VirB8